MDVSAEGAYSERLSAALKWLAFRAAGRHSSAGLSST